MPADYWLSPSQDCYQLPCTASFLAGADPAATFSTSNECCNFMIHRFEDLKNLYGKSVGLRYIGADNPTPPEVDGQDESDPRDEFFASATSDEVMQALETEPLGTTQN